VVLKEGRLANDEVERDVGEPDALGGTDQVLKWHKDPRSHDPNDSGTRAVTQNGSSLKCGRASFITLLGAAAVAWAHRQGFERLDRHD